MDQTAELILGLIAHHQVLVYGVIFLASIPEGPILTIICGYLSIRGLLNPFAVYLAVVLGDMIGDSIPYWGGRYGGRFIFSLFRKFAGVMPEHIEAVRRLYESRRFQMLSFSKLIHGVGYVGLVVAGMVRMSWARFVVGCALISLGQSLFLLMLGRVAGQAQETIGQYLNWYAAGVSMLALAVGVYLVLNGYLSRLLSQEMHLNGG